MARADAIPYALVTVKHVNEQVSGRSQDYTCILEEAPSLPHFFTRRGSPKGRRQGKQPRPQFIPNPSKNGRLPVSGGGGGILKILVNLAGVTREDGTGLSGAVADGDDEIELLIAELIDGF